MSYLPTAEQVAVAWLKTVTGVDATKVATTLPADVSVWAATGFWQVTVVGGTPATHTPLYMPVIRVDCWAANLASTKPPWGRAGSMAGSVVWATYHQPALLRVDPGAGFDTAHVLSTFPLSEPVRVPDDDAGFARVFVDLRLSWVVIPR